ncbi:Ankyrin repeat protein [Penicillium waksmanii]|uniref:Ankyrin repeat protein n=1 Tax=Penicillium waksmanii TaxID=69791 RepID=UPI0025466ACF|nr:Ankyrin repeat protein [Penicillium waksmanii]KAJ5999796.1 Ankyrin repeat protein [Penicillium waksmanii]
MSSSQQEGFAPSHAPLCTMASLKVLDSPESYTIAWIAALPIERAAAEGQLECSLTWQRKSLSQSNQEM